MALTFDLTKIENYQETGYDRDGRLRPVTDLLIWATLHVGFGEISNENADEFYARMMIIHRLHDICIIEDDKERMITPEEVRSHIGLTTNAGMNETRAQWIRRHFFNKRSITEDYARSYRRAMEAKVS